jgi:two-component system OmpR family sensor kinase
MFEANLATYKLRTETDKTRENIIIKQCKVLKREGFQSVDEELLIDEKGFYKHKTVKDLRATMVQFQNKIYFYIETPTGSILIEDEKIKPYRYGSILYTYATTITIILISFFLILQKLRPLIRLRKKIALFGDGDLSVSFKIKGSDEIALVANELEAAREKISTILESRTLFLRNIMHELKTPIAKGTIATQMLDSQKQRDRFTSIFGRLESLIEEFAMIEEVTTLNSETNFQEYRLIDIIDGAIDMAMVERNLVKVNIPASQKIFANYRLYTTAIKNMIDNGIKYSPDSCVEIVMRNDELCFESKGERLKNSLKYYIEPFTKDNPSKNSFGLGLYLVDSILKAHNQVLAHEYDNGINRFIFA